MLPRGIRKKIGLFKLRRELQHIKRSKVLCNLENAKEIGIVFSTLQGLDFGFIKQFILQLSKQGTKVQAMAFIPGNKIPEFYLLSSTVLLNTRRDLDYFYLPKSISAKDFINKPFDVLIDLSTDYFLPVHYTCCISKAGFKIGRYTDKHQCYDLMIDTGKSKNLEDLINQIKHYTKILS